MSALQAPQQQHSELDMLIQRGMTAHRAGRLSEAERSYRKAVKKAPQNLTAMNLLADVFLQMGKNARALDMIGKALRLKHDMPGAWMVQGTAQRQMGQFEAAVTSLQTALELKPDYADALLTLAATLKDMGELDDALDAYEELVELAPEKAEAHFNLANTLIDDDQIEEAIESYRRVVEINEHFPGGLHNLAAALHLTDQLEEALEVAERAINLGEEPTRSKLTRGNILRSMILLEEAEAQYRELIAADQDDADAHDMLGTVLQGQLRHDEANAEYRTAISLAPERSLFRGDLAICLLATGQLEEGWKLYEARFGNDKDLVMKRRVGRGEWAGESLAGKTLLVWKEQGIGDDLRFANCLPDLLAKADSEGGKVIIETDQRLVTLYARSFPSATVRVQGDLSESDRIDFDIAAGSLPRFFRNSISAFPETGGFLTANGERQTAYRAELDALGSGLKVGLAWRSRNMAADRRRFYTTIDQWKPLLDRQDIQFVNLQYDNATAELQDARSRLGASIHSVSGLDLMNDLDGAAALTAACDVVISAGTSVSDMAGALGVPVFTYGAAKHPMCLGTDTMPWFPSMTWIGKAWNEDLGPAVDKISAAVSELAENKG